MKKLLFIFEFSKKNYLCTGRILICSFIIFKMNEENQTSSFGENRVSKLRNMPTWKEGKSLLKIEYAQQQLRYINVKENYTKL